MLIAAAGSAVALGLLGAGCYFYEDDCHNIGTCSPGTGPSSSSTSSTGGHVNCDPAMGAVDGSCGVFVSSSMGDDKNDGSQGKPFATLGAALSKAGSGRVYACGEQFKETLTLSAGVTLYGALACSNGWTYDAGKKTVLTAEADAIPLTLASTAMGAEVLDVAVSAANATKPGGSSIAVVVDHATATFTRCSFVAGAAMDGDPGTSGGMPAMQAKPGLKGDDAGTMGTLNGGPGASNATCGLKGGNGGDGGLLSSPPGSDGTQGDGTQGGAKGSGQTLTAACSNGANGNLGMKVSDGLLTPGIGTIEASGYHGIDGQPGMNGTNGTSGGGGGGSMAMGTAHGAGGGGGGAGGCGGMLGTGGKAAGSSIALMSLSAKVTLASCTLDPGKGGKGGAGGDGQFGQPGGLQGNGGMAGLGASKGCAGGAGGDGGNGGNGSGGLGGHSLGIAATGTAPVLDAATKSAITPGVKGSGGKGGNMDASMNHGADGVAAACWDFGSNAACK